MTFTRQHYHNDEFYFLHVAHHFFKPLFYTAKELVLIESNATYTNQRENATGIWNTLDV